MAKKKILFFFGSALTVSILYLSIVAKPISPEFSLKPQWVIKIDNATPIDYDAATVKETIIPFVIGNNYGYIAPNGSILVKRTFQPNQFVSISSKFVSVCNPIPETLTIESITATNTIIVKNPQGYPFIVDDTILIIGKDQDSISLVNNTGAIEWSYNTTSPITTLDLKAEKIVIGSLDGTIQLLSKHGDSLFSFQPGGSRLSVILGAALSSDGRYIAIISGIDRQRFVLLEKTAHTYKVLYHQFLDSDFRRPVLITFAQNDQYVLFEGKTQLLVFNINSKKNYTIPIETPILALETLPQYNKIFVMTGKDLQKNLIVLELPDRKLISAPFISKESFLRVSGDQVILGSDGIIASYSARR
ncbi:hypothetical protein [Gracilinema caldarium]|uniref:Uncharacterized protein n=1 Tax=Gracilinema caldarium (strain ATCC 51460 / DSM 7334 / H1) TaxID=744872 RepID=F8EXG5_GRAC1|nr:hypothetical protein [Gracilinema caldarium]AEJ19192.1 hypothetical protein Spica_1043 [Gracilinema caldarium DSM 7334]